VQLFQELRRRNVIRVAVAYVVTAWLLLQVADLVLDAIGAPAWVLQSFLLLAAIGLVPTLLFAWAFELTPEGLRREQDVDRSQSITPQTGRKLDYAIIGLLAVVALYFIWESRFQGETAANTPEASATQTSGEVNGPDSFNHDSTNSIAVLPFANLSSDPEQEYFSDGISEELLNVLAQYPGLRVAARTSSFQFKGDNRDISEIAKLLRVNHVIEGSVRKAGNRLRITAQLIEAENGYHLWSETYDRELKDIFAVQDEISAAIGEALRRELNLPTIGALMPKVGEAANTAAYEAYLRGRHLINQRINQRSNAAIMEAVNHLEQSIRLDPEYAPSRAQLAIAYALSYWDSYGDLTLAQVNEKAAPQVDKALALNPNLADAWAAKCLLAQENSDHENAIEYAQHAIRLNPSNIDAMNWLYISAAEIGKYSLSYQTVKRMYATDPLSLLARVTYAHYVAVNTDPQEARRIANSFSTENIRLKYRIQSHLKFSEGDIAGAIGSHLLYTQDPSLSKHIVFYLNAANLSHEAMRLVDAAATSNAVRRELIRSEAASTPEQFRYAQQRAEEAIAEDPDNVQLLYPLAHAAYYAGNYDVALSSYARIHEDLPSGMVARREESRHPSLRYAWLLSRQGLLAEAEKWIRAANEDTRQMQDTPWALRGPYRRDKIFLALMAGDTEGALKILEATPVHLLAPRNELLDPAMEPLHSDPRFVAKVAEYDAWVAQQRAEVLDLICNRNPIPNAWQPLEETCSDVEVSAAL
jgi:TolB-like protein